MKRSGGKTMPRVAVTGARAITVVVMVLAALTNSAAAQSDEKAAPATSSAAPAADAATIAPPPVVSPAPDPALRARITALKAERAAIRFGPAIGMLAGGLGLVLAGATLGVQTLLYSEAVGTCGFGGCLTTPAASALGGTAAGLGVTGIVLIAVGAPKLRARLGARRALSEQIRQLLHGTQLSFDLRPAHAALTLKAKF